ncbi:YihY/virulence factor BrkB family protein [Streptomyces sp. SM14]|uniref:YihY/virulence factor BrkB family protein n=1 Tax=Streptomyces sp. SM14 TaxID=1736045 RepID=UPI000CD4FA1E|nr:YihY/virulence factor BrkB family protein [Streptomyces sp. SM14]
MDEQTKQKLSGLPWIGPAVGRLLTTRVWRVYEHMEDRNYARLAASITFISFLALFPVLALGAAIGFAFLSQDRMTDIEDWFASQVPGISESIDLQALFDNAATIGVVALALLVPTGAGWVSELRGCLRTIWDLPEPTENFLLRKVKDVGVLAGLGGVMLLSLAASALALSAVRIGARWLGVTGGAGGVLLQIAAYAVAIGVTSVLMVYLLVWLPGVRPPRAEVIFACVLGAVGFEVLKLVLSGYLTGVAAKSMYGAFGVPIALLIWINLMAKLLLFCCSWTATSLTAEKRPRADALETGDDAPDTGDDAAPGTPPPPSPADRAR